MNRYTGVVALDDGTVPVVVGLDDQTVSLVAGEIQIGLWSIADCVISDRGEGRWAIEAEDDSVEFTPDDPAAFADTLDLTVIEPNRRAQPEPLSQLHGEFEIVQGPRPRLGTIAVFYGLAAVTAALGIWAALRLFG